MKKKTGCMQDNDNITNILQLTPKLRSNQQRVTKISALGLYLWAWECEQFMLTGLNPWDSSNESQPIALGKSDHQS